MSILACGNCVFYAMWQRFPPIQSWVVIIPVWFLVLSAIHTFSMSKLAGMLQLFVALPLVFAMFLFAPGMIGPPLGIWIPVCVIVATISGMSSRHPAALRRSIAGIAVVALMALFGFGRWDYVAYNRMPAAEKERYIPCWEVIQKRQRDANERRRNGRAENSGLAVVVLGGTP